VIFGYDYPDWPMDPAIDAFAVLASDALEVAPCVPAGFDSLVHPVHRSGRVFGWELPGIRWPEGVASRATPNASTRPMRGGGDDL